MTKKTKKLVYYIHNIILLMLPIGGNMMLDYILVAVFASFPEALLALLMGFNLSNIRNIKISKFLVIAGIQSIIALFVRMFNVYFGFHTIIQVVSLYLLVLIFTKIKYYKAIIPVLIGLLSIGIIQSIIFPISGKFLDFETINLYYISRKLILATIPVFLVSFVLLIFIMKKKFFLCDIND